MAQQAADNDPFLRYPDICGERIAFSFAGDIWLQQGQETQARRLTSSPGTEYFPKFSPDCQKIAFSGQIDGDDQVYVMPAQGGEAKRLTNYPSRKGMNERAGRDNQVVGWNAEGSAVLFRSLRDAAMPSQSNLYTVDARTGQTAPVGMARAGMGAFSPDGSQLVYSPWSRDFRTWKQYRGGWAQDLWIYDRSSGKSRQITKTTATERDPIWTKQGIFFLSDRNGRMNLFRQNPETGEAEQVTSHEDDAMWASAERNGNIIYEVKGRIWTYDPASRSNQQRHIHVPSDVMQARPRYTDFSNRIDSFSPASDGERALFVARGDIFSIGATDATARALTSSSGAQDREAVMSVDKKWVAFISDQTGEEELWVVPAEGGAARQITRNNKNRFSRPSWSPDGKRIIISGKDGAIYLVTIADGAMREIGRSGSVFIRDYSWSPNSRYLAYTRFNPNDMGQIQIFDTASNKTVVASDKMFNSYQPTFSADGNYLYMLTEREFATRFTSTEWNFQVPPQRTIAFVPVRNDLPNPFSADIEKRPTPAANAVLDPDGITQRLLKSPIPTGNIVNFVLNAQDIVYATLLDGKDDSYKLQAYGFEKKDSRSFDGLYNSFAFSADGKFAVTRAGGDFAVLDVASGKWTKLAKNRLAGTVEPRREWAAVFNGVCRRYRDFFYVSTMHGFDWEGICASYREQLPRVASRGDLTELIGRMVAELNVSHAYIDGRDEQQAANPGSGALGGVFTFDTGKQQWRIDRILAGDPIDPVYRSPLAELGNQVRVGDWLLAIDGLVLNADKDPYTALTGKSDQSVTLTIKRDGQQGQQDRIVKTIANQDPLFYREWSERNRKLVDRASEGRIGYIHIPAMSPQGLSEFARGYYAQIRKDGMIVDIRGNQGGNISPILLDRLWRKFLTTGHVKGMDYPTTYPWGNFTQVFTGKMALLVNESTMSDGDTMTYEWRQAGLGPIYGKRTWGGTVGTGSMGPLIDGTETNVPQYGLADTKGNWVVEGQGVSPDVELSFDDETKFGGDDMQLMKATQLLGDQIRGTPGTLPPAAPAPDKRPSHSK